MLQNHPSLFAPTSDTGFYPYTVDNSCRFNAGDTPELSRNQSSGNNKIATFSGWFKRGSLTGTNTLITAGRDTNTSVGDTSGIRFDSDNILQLWHYDNAYQWNLKTNAVYRDTSAWYHIVMVIDTTQATSSNRIKLYVNGEQVTSFSTAVYPSQNYATNWNDGGEEMFVGYTDSTTVGAYHYDGYMAETCLIDGQALDPTSFGEDKNGIWVPKDVSGLTFGTNGFYLDFADSAALGNDVSGNNNDFTSSGLTSSDSMIDTPTNNFATWNPLKLRDTASAYWPLESYSEGNLTTTHPSSVSSGTSYTTLGVPDDTKMYCEIYVSARGAGGIGIDSGSYGNTGSSSDRYLYDIGGSISGPSSSTSGSSHTTGDIIGICIDRVSDEVAFYKNGSLQGTLSGLSDKTFFPFFLGNNNASRILNAGQNGTFNGNVTAGGNTDANGIGDFKYTVPTDALALCTANLPEPTIGPNSDIKPSDCFATVLYTGNGTAIGSGGKAITGVGFQPDMVWIKNRDAADSWMCFDSVRGATKYIELDSTDMEATDTETLSSFDADGFTLGNNVAVNTSGEDYVAYCFKITAGFFDIQTYVGSTTPKAINHDLGVVPNFIHMKLRTTYTSNSAVYVDGGQVSDPETDYYQMSTTSAASDNATLWNDTAPTSTQWTIGTANNLSGEDYIVYLFADVEGFCKTFSYIGNGNVDGPFQYLGFSPQLNITKRSDNLTGGEWKVVDIERMPYNWTCNVLFTDSPSAENTTELESTYGVDILSNGNKVRASHSSFNASGGDYITLSIGGNTIKYSNAR